MEPEYRNIYKTARKSAGFTQEAAAERLGLCVESLRAYECGYRIPPNDVVARMAVAYNNLMLGYDHCRSTDDLMASIVPRLEQRSVMEIVVRLFNRMKRLDDKGRVSRLLEIAEDGQIDQGERAEFEDIMSDIQEIIQTGLELRLAGRED